MKILIAGELKDASVVADDPANDLAVIKLKEPMNGYSFNRSAQPKLGSPVFTLGYPNPLMQGIDVKFTGGEVSGIKGILDDPRTMQISVPIQPGNSGGPLFNEKGEFVGIVVAKLNERIALRTTGALPENVGYAIKANYVEPLLATVEGYEPASSSPAMPKDRSEVIALLQPHVAMILTFGGSSPRPDQITDSNVVAFVSRFIESGQGPADAQLPFFAERVEEYFGQPNLDQRAILQDRKDYVTKWPVREFELVGQPVVQERKPDGTIVVAARFNYAVRNATRTASGEGINVLALRTGANGLKIVWVGEELRRDEADPATERLANHVLAFLREGDSDSVTGQIGFYADRVRYFDEGVKTKAEILQDQKEYEAKWPKRRHEVRSKPTVTRIGDDRYLIRVEASFFVSDGSRSRIITGRSEIELATDREVNKGMITGIAIRDVTMQGN